MAYFYTFLNNKGAGFLPLLKAFMPSVAKEFLPQGGCYWERLSSEHTWKQRTRYVPFYALRLRMYQVLCKGVAFL